MAERRVTVVVNLRTEIHDVYIGRPSEFGNPYTVERHGRERAIELYRQSFLDRVENDRAFRLLVMALHGKRLGCFCKPLDCHGDIIAAWVNEQAGKK